MYAGYEWSGLEAAAQEFGLKNLRVRHLTNPLEYTGLFAMLGINMGMKSSNTPEQVCWYSVSVETDICHKVKLTPLATQPEAPKQEFGVERFYTSDLNQIARKHPWRLAVFVETEDGVWQISPQAEDDAGTEVPDTAPLALEVATMVRENIARFM